MTRLWLAVTFFLACSEGISGQEPVKKNLCGMQAGITIPYSGFAKKTFESSDPGFAGTGGNLEADYIRLAGRFFGFSLNLGYAWLAFDAEAYEKAYGEILPDQQVRVQAGAYHVAKGTVGLIFRTPGRYRTEFMLNPWLGYAAARHPEIVATSDFYGQINTVEKSWGCRVIGGLTLFAGYDLTGRMKLGLSYRRNAANFPFTDKTSREGRFYLPFKYQNLSLGLQVYL